MAQQVPVGDVAYSAREIARHLGVSIRQVYVLVAADRLPVWREGKSILARRSSLNEWVLNREAAAREQAKARQVEEETA